MAVETVQELLALVEKSHYLNGEQLREAMEAAGQTVDARAAAKALLQKNLLTRWQAGQLLGGRSETVLGKYRLIDLLGRGGMGRVFLARHTMMNRPVALKVIAKRLGQDPSALGRFFTEARAVAALDHPNIVHAYDVGNEGERYYLVMEYVEGRDLQRTVESDGPLDIALAADVIRQAADGLAHAHAKGMIHCDVKPANLLVNRQGVVKILDMGIARAVGREEQTCVLESDEDDSQTLIGTVDYMAPEQALGDESLDCRADIYSLGCTFYYLLTGRPPFPEGTLAQRIVKHQTQEPDDIARLRPEIPRELIRICRTMMAKEPSDRFQTAGEVSQAIAGCFPEETDLPEDVPPVGDEDGLPMPLESQAAAADRSAIPPEVPPSHRWPDRASAAAILCRSGRPASLGDCRWRGSVGPVASGRVGMELGPGANPQPTGRVGEDFLAVQGRRHAAKGRRHVRRPEIGGRGLRLQAAEVHAPSQARTGQEGHKGRRSREASRGA